MISPYLQNPTGICYSESNKKSLINLAEKYDCYIIEDGTFNEFIFDHTPLVPLYEHYSKERVIFLYHFSRLYMPYLTYSFAVLPHMLMKRIADDTSCTFNERLLLYYLESTSLPKLQKELFEESKHKYEFLYKSLKELANKFEVKSTHGGLSFWIKPLTTNRETFCQYLSKSGFIVSPGNLFTTQDSCEFVRLSISQLPLEDIEKLIYLLNNLV